MPQRIEDVFPSNRYPSIQGMFFAPSGPGTKPLHSVPGYCVSNERSTSSMNKPACQLYPLPTYNATPTGNTESAKATSD